VREPVRRPPPLKILRSKVRNGQTRILSDSDSLDGLDEQDPESISRFMKQMGDELGEDTGKEVEAMLDSAENGLSEDGTTDCL
jgi:hypothetical protein